MVENSVELFCFVRLLVGLFIFRVISVKVLSIVESRLHMAIGVREYYKLNLKLMQKEKIPSMHDRRNTHQFVSNISEISAKEFHVLQG